MTHGLFYSTILAMGVKETIFRIAHARKIEEAETNHDVSLNRLTSATARFERPGIIGRIAKWPEIKQEKHDAGHEHTEARLKHHDLRVKGGLLFRK